MGRKGKEGEIEGENRERETRRGDREKGRKGKDGERIASWLLVVIDDPG